jgi:uncharacterized membrane protein
MDLDTAAVEGPTLSAWMYDSPRGAAAGKLRLNRLSRRGGVAVVDAAVVTWVKGAHRPRVGRPHLAALSRAADPSPLEVLLGQLLFPRRRPGDSLVRLAWALEGSGVTEDYLRELRAGLVPDTSALLVLSRGAALHEVQLVIERGRARGDVRLLLAPLTSDGLGVLQAFARGSSAASG